MTLATPPLTLFDTQGLAATKRRRLNYEPLIGLQTKPEKCFNAPIENALICRCQFGL